MIPAGMTEAEVVKAIDDVAFSLGKHFGRRFPDMGRDDVEQEVRMLAWEVLQRGVYDQSRDLRSFIFVHCKLRLLNRIRDKVCRPDSESACQMCANGEPCQPDGENCPTYKAWLKRNRAKASLAGPKKIDRVVGDSWEVVYPKTEEHAEMKELLALIDQEISLELRSDYLKMRDGMSLPKPQREKVQRAVLEILHAAGVGKDLGLPDLPTQTTDEPTLDELLARAACLSSESENEMADKAPDPATNNPAEGNTTFQQQAVLKPVPTLDLTPPTPNAGFYPRATPPSTSRDRR